MKFHVPVAIAALTALNACSAGSGFFGSDESLFIGTRGASSSANGLPFAVASSVVEDLEAAGSVDVKVVRVLTDWESGSTRLLISDETATLAAGDIAGDLDGLTITLAGETLVFSGGVATPANNQTAWQSYVNTVGTVSGTGSIYSYEGGSTGALSGEFDSEAFFAFGYETDPDEIAALVGSAIYTGTFDGYGQVLDPASGAVLANEQRYNGTFTLVADFDASSVSGALDGTFAYDGTAFAASFMAPVEGNGYSGTLDAMTCMSATCISSTRVGGAFFGANAPETSGLIGMDVRVTPVGGSEYRVLGGGGFTAVQ